MEARVAGAKTHPQIFGNGFSMNSSDWEAVGRINFPFDLGADSSEEWRCNIPWESFLSPAAVQTELPH
jgi:hypothetical protein